MNGQAKNRTKLRFAQSVKVRISTRIGRKAGYNGECRIYSFAFNGGIIRLCVFVHNDPGALDLLHDGWEETGLETICKLKPMDVLRDQYTIETYNRDARPRKG